MIDNQLISKPLPLTPKLKTVNNKIQHFALTNLLGTKAVISNYGQFLDSLFVFDKKKKLVNIIENARNLYEAFQLTMPSVSLIEDLNKDQINDTNFNILKRKENPNLKKTVFFDFEKFAGNLICDVVQPKENLLELRYFLKKIEGSFPANLKIKITYSLGNDNSLKITMEAFADRNIILNFDKPVCFNLNGDNSGNILNHLLQINAERYFPVNSNLCSVLRHDQITGTPFDFNKATTIGARINDNNEQLKIGNGYCHSFLLNKHSLRTPVAKMMGDKTGIKMEMFTDAPVLHFYSGNAAFNVTNGSDPEREIHRNAFALAPQLFNNINCGASFPAMVLNANQEYKLTVRYRFTAD